METGSIILISGKRRSGKSTLARYLRGYGYTTTGFADWLYILHNRIWAEHEPIWGEHGDLERDQRERLIDLGAALRCVHPDALVRLTASEINDDYLISRNTKFVIPNYRFPNEKNIVQYLQFPAVVHTVRVTREGQTFDDGLDDDPSETSLDGEQFDSIVRAGDGQLYMLQDAARALADFYAGRR
jgi:energy-coupling factor transporter ATP-binding protein EcfA2